MTIDEVIQKIEIAARLKEDIREKAKEILEDKKK
jgi:hypothetical protein